MSTTTLAPENDDSPSGPADCTKWPEAPQANRGTASSPDYKSRGTAPAPVFNALTFDVEEWFHAHNLAVPRAAWADLPSRLAEPIDDILSLLGHYRTFATFFVLGWVARRSPGLVRRIRRAGHEIAAHGHWHQPLTEQTPGVFAADVREARSVIEDITGQRVLGYRAPGYSIGPETAWALDILAEQGWAYDSSIYPARAPHGRYGWPEAPLSPWQVRTGLWEFPLPTRKLLGWRFPAATGGYLRLFPLSATQQAIAQNAFHNIPVVVNLHPWELDRDQPRVAAPLRGRVLHYSNLHTTRGKLETLLQDYKFIPLRDALARLAPVAASKPRRLVELPQANTVPPSRIHAIGELANAE